ncbi:MAG: hypothetical protein ACO2O2_16770 [Acidilobaceae archaeon]
MSVEEHLRTAQVYLSETFKLYKEGYRAGVCEKVWAAVKHATIALTTKFLGVSEPKGIPWREFVREAFEKAGLSGDEASYWASYFIDVRRGLHGGCFYSLYYEESGHKPLIERTPQYVNLVAELVKRGSTP